MTDLYPVFLAAILALFAGFILIVGGVSIWSSQTPRPTSRLKDDTTGRSGGRA